MNPKSWASPDLQSLVDLFYDESTELGEFTEVPASEVPEPYKELLAHNAHMTVTVERFFGSLVDVHVVATKQTPTHYSRKILLSKQSDRQVVQFGLVRLTKSLLAPETFSEIESEQEPLGRILIRHNVLRDVKLLSVWRVAMGPELAAHFSAPLGTICYGRTALIYCNQAPAVELLEIVWPD